MNKISMPSGSSSCIVCERHDKTEFASYSNKDSGPWVCSDCGDIVEKFLNATGLILAQQMSPSHPDE
jgi:hypothetical protein